MVWYEHLNRSTPYLKNYRRWNMWYDYNNSKHHEIRRMRSLWLEHILRRMTKHEAHTRFFLFFVVGPMLFWLNKTKKRFAAEPEPEPFLYSGPQYVAAIGRNQMGFESSAAKSFEHVMSIILGNEIMSHILNQDADVFKAEELSDDDQGLSGDLSEEDALDLLKDVKPEPHLGIVYRHPNAHYLNEKPNDFLSVYKLEGESKKH